MSVSSPGATPTTPTTPTIDQSGPNKPPQVPDGKQYLNGKFPPIELPIVPMPSINTYFPKAESELSEKPVDDQSTTLDQLGSSTPRLANSNRRSIGTSDNSANSSHQFSRSPTLTSDTTQLASTTSSQANHNEFAEKNKIQYQSEFNQVAELANNGNKLAEYNLGCMFYNGIDIAKNEREAIHWFTKAAEQGFIPAQLN